MIIIRLKVGMGNQMFQYAFGRSMAERLGTELFLDLSLLLDRGRGENGLNRDFDLDYFNIDPQFGIEPQLLRSAYRVRSPKIGKFIRSLVAFNRSYVKEAHFHVVEEVLRCPQPDAIYEGWWQSERYFSEIRDRIRREFSFKDPPLPEAGELFGQIEHSNSICLNVRRTDFLQVPTLNTTDKGYFLRAAREMAERVADPHFFVFSDDVEWCRAQLQLEYPFRIVGHEVKGRKFGNYLRLMMSCKHFIIPNSSFAWWAVWLSCNPSKVVIAPKNWFNDDALDTVDLVPEAWIRL